MSTNIIKREVFSITEQDVSIFISHDETGLSLFMADVIIKPDDKPHVQAYMVLQPEEMIAFANWILSRLNQVG